MANSASGPAGPDFLFEVQPLTARIGAEIRGIVLSGDLPAAHVAAIREAVLRHRVVFFRGQGHLDEAGHEAFAQRLGAPFVHPTIRAHVGTQHVHDVDGTKVRASAWHSDVAYVAAPPSLSILRTVTLPPVGGDTLWANSVAAYDNLPAALRDLADKLRAIHTNDFDYYAIRPDASVEELQRFKEKVQSTLHHTEHPLVQRHPETGELALLIGQYLQRIVGLPVADSMHLLAIFHDHVTRPENTVRWRWVLGDVAIWDNRTTVHKVIDDWGAASRILRRVSLAGTPLVGVDGRESAPAGLSAAA
jgi:taurine dioxygenase